MNFPAVNWGFKHALRFIDRTHHKQFLSIKKEELMGGLDWWPAFYWWSLHKHESNLSVVIVEMDLSSVLSQPSLFFVFNFILILWVGTYIPHFLFFWAEVKIVVVFDAMMSGLPTHLETFIGYWLIPDLFFWFSLLTYSLFTLLSFWYFFSIECLLLNSVLWMLDWYAPFWVKLENILKHRMHNLALLRKVTHWHFINGVSLRNR